MSAPTVYVPTETRVSELEGQVENLNHQLHVLAGYVARSEFTGYPNNRKPHYVGEPRPKVMTDFWGALADRFLEPQS